MAKVFWKLMIWIDEHINHTVGDWLYNRFNPENNAGTFWDFNPKFCWWAWQGYYTRYNLDEE